MATFSPRIPKFARGIRFRLSLVYSVLFGICIVALSLFITNEYFKLAREDYDQYLRNFAIDLTNSIHLDKAGHNVTLQIPRSEEIKFFPFVIQNTLVMVRDMEGNILYSNHKDVQVPYLPEIGRKRGYTHRFMDFTRGSENMRGLNLKVNLPDGRSLILQVANSSEGLRRVEDRHVFFLLTVIPLTILLAGGIASAVAGKALDPIQLTVNRMEDMIQDGNFRQLPMPKTHDEIETLTVTFNNMISQVQRTLEAQEKFVSHASHQLNTPLAIMRGELEVLMSKERSPQEVKDFHQSLHQELQRLTQLVKDMLLVSRVEAGKEHFQFLPLRLDEVLGETLERLAVFAKTKSVALRYNIDPVLIEDENRLTYPGERQLLVCLFENILENAIKYSPAHSRISVKLSSQEQLVVEIADEGIGMDPKVLEAFKGPKRFQRGEEVSGISGSGLGLYLARRIADYHNARLDVEPNQPRGTRFKVSFLIAPSPA